jgi:hypothetical protein
VTKIWRDFIMQESYKSEKFYLSSLWDRYMDCINISQAIEAKKVVLEVGTKK